MADRMEALLDPLLKDPAVASVAAAIGPGGSTATLNQGRVFIALKPHDERDVSSDQVIDRLQTALAKVQGITLYMQAAQDITVGGRVAKTQYQYTLTDADQNELNRWSAIFLDKLKDLPQIADVTSDQENAGPLLNATVNRDTASSFGILPSTVDNTLGDAFGQRIVSTIYTALNQYHVVLEVDPRFQRGPEALNDIYVNSSAAQEVPLSTLVDSNITAAPIVINHQGLFPATTISFNLKPGVALGDAVDAIRKIEQQSGKPQSLVTTFQGNANAFLSSLAGEPLLIAAALVTIYIILGVLYESTIHPITILSTLPSAGIGALLMLMAVDLDLSVIAMLGILLLIGIVKKNGILMVDFALQLERNEGLRPRGRDLSGLRAALQADPDDHHGGAARSGAADARDRRRLGNPPAARLRDRGRIAAVANPHPVHHPGRLSLSRPPERVSAPRARHRSLPILRHQPGLSCAEAGASLIASLAAKMTQETMPQVPSQFAPRSRAAHADILAGPTVR